MRKKFWPVFAIVTVLVFGAAFSHAEAQSDRVPADPTEKFWLAHD